MSDGTCRDRAEERRKGLNPDYERTAMSGLPTDSALNPTMSVEETKYLGGDLEHTHLVKGLDYALLQKVFLAFTNLLSRSAFSAQQAIISSCTAHEPIQHECRSRLSKQTSNCKICKKPKERGRRPSRDIR